MQHFLILRTSLEPQACSLAAIHANPQQKERLATLMAEMRALHIDFDREYWIQIDSQFHQLIYEASGNPFLMSFANLFNSVYQSYFRAITENEVIKLEHHQAIVDTILTGDSAGALAACQLLLKEKE
jgi:DNA-binding FadR family transcriptional regulator